MKKAVLFDLGNTLVSYYSRQEFPMILREAIGNCREELTSKGIMIPDDQRVWLRVKEQDHGSPRNKVHPLSERLSTIFGVTDATVLDELCIEFMKPIFRAARLHDDAKPTLKSLREIGVKTAIISNTPWGSPAHLWRRELRRHGLSELVDTAVFCGDVGWRKPDPRIFQHTLDRLGLEAGDCLFVGDDPRWDIDGPRALGMDAVLIDRTGRNLAAVHTLDCDQHCFKEVTEAITPCTFAFNQISKSISQSPQGFYEVVPRHMFGQPLKTYRRLILCFAHNQRDRKTADA